MRFFEETMHTTYTKPKMEARAAFDKVYTRLVAGNINSAAALQFDRKIDQRTQWGHITEQIEFSDQQLLITYIIPTGVATLTAEKIGLGIGTGWFFSCNGAALFSCFPICSRLSTGPRGWNETKMDKIGLAADFVWLIFGVWSVFIFSPNLSLSFECIFLFCFFSLFGALNTPFY